MLNLMWDFAKPESDTEAQTTTQPQPVSNSHQDVQDTLAAMKEFMKKNKGATCNFDGGCESCQ